MPTQQTALPIFHFSPDNEPNPNSIVLGDSVQVLKQVPDESVQLIITSPPYWNLVDYGFKSQIGQSSYIEYLQNLLEVWRECERILCPNGKMCINVPIVPIPKKDAPDSHTREIKNLANDIEYTVLSSLKLARFSLYIWQKQTTVKMFGSYPYPPNLFENNTIEFINVYVKPGKPRKLSQKIKDDNKLEQDEWLDLTRQIWWIYPEDIQRDGGHPAPFPILLPLRLIKMFSFGAVQSEHFDGDIILDPFCGSGTTCAAAKTLGRRYIGIDGSRKYVIGSKERLSQTSENRRVNIRLRRLSDADKALEEHKQMQLEI